MNKTARAIALDLIEKYDGKVLQATTEELHELRDASQNEGKKALTVLFEANRERGK